MLRNSPKFSFHRPQMTHSPSYSLGLVLVQIQWTASFSIQLIITNVLLSPVFGNFVLKKKYSDFCYSSMWVFPEQNNKHNSYIFRVNRHCYRQKFEKWPITRHSHWYWQGNTTEIRFICQSGKKCHCGKDCNLGRK